MQVDPKFALAQAMAAHLSSRTLMLPGCGCGLERVTVSSLLPSLLCIVSGAPLSPVAIMHKTLILASALPLEASQFFLLLHMRNHLRLIFQWFLCQVLFFRLAETYTFHNSQIMMGVPDDDDSGYIMISEVSSKMWLQHSTNCLYQLVFSERVTETSQGLRY